MTSYEIENKIIPGLPKNGLNGRNFIIAHDTANDNSTIDNEVSYMSRNWNNAFVTHFVGGGGRVVQVASAGYVSWGCGSAGNGYAYAQVELCHAKTRDQFNKDYAVYCQLLVDLAKQAGIPISLDSGSRTSDRGIKTHDWITKKLGKTSHTDPYGYLSRWGISKAQFEKDLKAAASGSSSNPAAIQGTVTDVAPLLPKAQFKDQTPIRKWKSGVNIQVRKHNDYWYKASVEVNGKWVTGYIYRAHLKNVKPVKGTDKFTATTVGQAIWWDNDKLNGGEVLYYKPGTKMSHYGAVKGLYSAWFSKQNKKFYTTTYWLDK
ncbi:hypothetical protein JH67_03100 [Listeria monocytogenes]|nr:hypothetical protein [Listeria monocytogenes]